MALSAVSLVGGVGMLLVAIGFVAYALLRRLGWRFLALGMLAWVVTVAIKVMIALPLNTPVIEATKSLDHHYFGLSDDPDRSTQHNEQQGDDDSYNDQCDHRTVV